MLETPHVAVGVAIATKFPNPALAIPLSFVSHFLLERVPHWNPHLNTEMKKFGRVTTRSTVIVIVDVMISLALGFFVSSRQLPNYAHAMTIIFSAFAAVLPDVIEGPYFFLNYKNSLIEKWISFQKSIQVDTGVVWGLVTQILTITAAFWWIFS